jgi:hypothetical protein
MAIFSTYSDLPLQLFKRVEKALELDHCAVPHMEVKGTTSAIDVTQAFYQVRFDTLN